MIFAKPMKYGMKSMRWIGIVLTVNLLVGCVEMQTAATLISAGVNAYSAKLDNEKKVYSKECFTQKFIYLDDGFEERLTLDEKKQVLAYNKTRERDCPDYE
jgi:biotin synthase-like enzyme